MTQDWTLDLGVFLSFVPTPPEVNVSANHDRAKWLREKWSMKILNEQEVRLRIDQHGKPGCFKSTAENFLVYIASISLASGPSLWSGPILSMLFQFFMGEIKTKPNTP